MKPIKAKNRRMISKERLIATVDIGKNKNMGYWRTPGGIQAKPFEFFNSGSGFVKFWEHVSKAMKIHSLEEVVVAIESTGPYGESFCHYLAKKKEVKLVQVNPMHTKRLKDLQGNSPNKTDAKDPKVIADIVELGHALTVVIPEGPAAELRRLTQARERAMRRRTSLYNTLQQLVFVIFPEFCEIVGNMKTESVRYLLEHCPGPLEILKQEIDELADTLRRISRGQFKKDRIQELYQAARKMAGIQEGQESIVFEIREHINLIKGCEDFISEIESLMSNYLKQINYSKFILSIKGIGEVTAAGIIGEVGDFNKFNTISELEKLAGLNLFEKSSGKHKGVRRISKRGRCMLRKLLFLAALCVVRKG